MDRWLGSEEEAQAVDPSDVDSRRVSPSVRLGLTWQACGLMSLARYFPFVSVLNVLTTRVTHGAGESWPPYKDFHVYTHAPVWHRDLSFMLEAPHQPSNDSFSSTSPLPEPWHFIPFCLVTKWCLTLCDSMDCSMQTSLSFTISWSLLKLMSIDSVMPSNHLFL